MFMVVVWTVSVWVSWLATNQLFNGIEITIRQLIIAGLVNSLSLGFGVGIVWQVIDYLTPDLSFGKISLERPELMIALISVVLVVLGYLLKLLSVRLIPM